MVSAQPLSLEDVVVATYSALDDALQKADIRAYRGKLIPRRGPTPKMDDREVLCLVVLQELLGFESDNAYHLWLEANPTMRQLFPDLISRQQWAERRAILCPLIQQLTQAFCQLEAAPLFTSSIPTPFTSAGSSGARTANDSTAWPRRANALR